jgi:CheY-like chemotaxis protein
MPPIEDGMNTSLNVSSNPGVMIGEPQRLLYIEDNQSNLALVEWLLDRQADVELFSAMRGRHGLELAQEHQPDLIVLDLHLPDMAGETVLQCLQADVSTRRIPVVVLSADTSEKRIKRLLQLGASDYLTKPLDIPRLLEVIAALPKQRS